MKYHQIYISSKLVSLLYIGIFLLCGTGSELLISKESKEFVSVDPNLVIFVSDMHLAPKPEIRLAQKQTKGVFLRYYQKPVEKDEKILYYDTRASFQRFIQEVLAMNPRPSAVFLLGDIASNTEKKTYDEFRRMLRSFDQADIKYWTIMGNHDNFDNFYSCFPDNGKSLVDKERWQGYRIELPLVDFVLMQTYAPRGGDRQGSLLRLMSEEEKEYMKKNSTAFIYEGWITPEQCQWMKKQAQINPSKPILFCGHHPIDLEKSFPDYKSLPNFQGWINGHYHTFYQSKTKNINGQKSCRSLFLPSSGTPGIGFNTDSPGYVILKITDQDYRFTCITFKADDSKNKTTITWPLLTP